MPICDAGERVDENGLAYKGSMLQMQLYANQHPGELSAAATDALGIPSVIDWVSPAAAERYAEYRDADFLRALGLERFGSRLASFWPRNGPCWDGLGIWSSPSEATGPVLVEAKSYPEEAHSSMAAKSEESRTQIESALARTSYWLGVSKRPGSWVEGRYQTSNRLAHLYFLREECGVDASLLYLLVVNDPTHKATGHSAWESAWTLMWEEMGLSESPPHTAAVLLPGLPRPIEA